MNSTIAILYGPMGGNTEKVAKLIVDELGEANCELVPVDLADENTIKQFSHLIIGGATIGRHNWNDESSNSAWEAFLPKLRKAEFSNKKVAIFGLGDHIAYADHFVDDIKLIYDAVVEQKGTIVGLCSTDGYEFNDSEALVDGKFIGLAIDEDHEKDKTEPRIKAWAKQLKAEFKPM